MIETLIWVALYIAVVGLTIFVRRRETGAGLPDRNFWRASGVGVVAAGVGTAFKVSGVLLTVPVVLAIVYALARSVWRLGDSGLFLMILGMGMGLSYILVAAVDPDTGSYADQGAQALVILGAVVCATAMVWSSLHGRRRISE